MFDDEPSAEATARIDEWEQAFQRRAERAQLLARRTEGLGASARSADHLVQVTVNGNGQLTDLRLDEGIRRQSAATTAGAILATLRRARADLLRQFDEATAETVGADSETGRALMRSMRDRLGSVDAPIDDRGGPGAIL
ncbi:YbaB/EbfC family nucleoid-associated protein [Actinoplanes sp. NPDC049548]|uniref:YbaB/EbfC family nucleoid-associated protein n=1 Tax=Actinoplanes sp. NPDC049548 TaxID=3155152 RepID=UPI00342DCF4C